MRWIAQVAKTVRRACRQAATRGHAPALQGWMSTARHYRQAAGPGSRGVLHHGHGVHEVEAHELFRPVGTRGEAGDRNRGGIRRQDRLGPQMGQQVFENCLLDRLTLGCGLDDLIATDEIFIRFGGRHTLQTCAHISFGDDVPR